MREKIIAILKKNHLHHYGDFGKAVEELEILFKTKNKRTIKPKVDKDTCAHHFIEKRGIFMCSLCNETMGEWLVKQNPESVCDGCHQKGSEYCAQSCKEEQK